jgi:hypothetical protein
MFAICILPSFGQQPLDRFQPVEDQEGSFLFVVA